MLWTVLIVDDNAQVRTALRAFLEGPGNMQVCGEAADGVEAVEKAKQLNPGLVLMDLSMPQMNGLRAAWTIKQEVPETRIIVFTLFTDVFGKVMAKTSGVDVIVSKTEGADGLLKALRPYLGDLPSPED